MVYECLPASLDVLIIEDVSSSIMKSDYQKMKDFILNIVKGLDISQKSNNVAFLSFAKAAKVSFYLNAHYNNTRILTAIESHHGEGGGSNISSALKLSASDVFTDNNGDRADADNIVLLFTDGMYKDKSSLQHDLEVLKARAEVYVVTVGSIVSNTTLAEMATSPEYLLKLGDPLTTNKINSVLSPCKI
ncbi:cartilage matrix protein-like [Haliotis asinina]|uniref:cartilage matrix protein-like n=1 Tax=Haliotis asinina TaxID=109174 RepID=UPI0035320B37